LVFDGVITRRKLKIDTINRINKKKISRTCKYNIFISESYERKQLKRCKIIRHLYHKNNRYFKLMHRWSSR
jgi:hypothetical protein